MRNKFEKKINDRFKRAKVVYGYEPKKIPYTLVRNYIPDYYFITRKSRKKVYVECKGFLRPEHRAKLVAVKRCNPSIDLRIVFYSDNPKYKKWADRHGFVYAISNIPKEWLNE